jgi:signal transduction histidine kinase
LLAALAAQMLMPSATAEASDGRPQVLVLYSLDLNLDVPEADAGDAPLPGVLENQAPGGVEYRSEFLDPSRFYADNGRALHDFLRSKYKGQRFDSVIAFGDASGGFIQKHRDLLFPDTPVVFFPSALLPAPSAWDRYGLHVVGAVLLLLVQMALIVGLLFQASKRQQAEAQLREKQAELQASYVRIRDLGGRLLNAQEDERSRIARALHDDIGLQVAVVAMDLELLRAASRDADGDLAGETLNRVHGIARSVRDLSLRLHPAKLKLIGLVPALSGLQREFSRADVSVRITHEMLPPSLPHDLTLCLFRIIEEALRNAVTHGKAHEVYVHLTGSHGRIAVTIVDDGTGFDLAEAWGRGLGLLSMRERLDRLGGTLEISSDPGAGTRIDVDVVFDHVTSPSTVAV